jgi:hypothetical protein
VPDQTVARQRGIRATRSRESTVTGQEERAARLRVGAADVARGRVRDVVVGGGVAVGAEEEVVGAAGIGQGGRLNQRAIRIAAVDELNGVADLGHAIVRADLLEHDGRGHVRLDAVVAETAVSDRVAVHLVHDIAAAVAVTELRRVNVATGGQVTDEWVVIGREGAGRRLRGGGTNAVLRRRFS